MPTTPPVVNQPALIDTEPARVEATAGQWWQRGARTTFQVTTIQAVLQAWQAFATVPLTETQYAALTVLLTTLFAIGQVLLEDVAGVAFLRTPQGRARRRTKPV